MDSIPDHILQKSQDTIRELGEIFSSIGHSASKRSELYIKLWSQIANVYDEFLRREANERDKLIQELVQKQQDIELLESQLGLRHAPLSKKSTLLEQEEELKKRDQELQKIKQERLSQLNALISKLNSIYEDLGENTEEKIGTDLSLNAVRELERKIELATAERNERAKRNNQLIAEITAVCADLGEPAELYTSKKGYSMAVYQELQNNLAILEKERSERKVLIMGLLKSIEELWNKLEVPQEERERFLNSRAGVSHAVINEIKQELARLQKEMEAKLHDLIDAVVEKVKRLQDILCVDETERAVHDACYGGKYTEEALDAHKVLLKKLEAKYKEAQPIFQLIDKRNELLQKKQELEKRMADPARFSGKLSSRHFMEEDKLRKAVSKLPATEKELVSRLQSWKNIHNEPFKYKNEDILVSILEAIEDEERQKQERKARKEAEKRALRQESALQAAMNAVPAGLLGNAGFVGISTLRTPSKTTQNVAKTPAKTPSEKSSISKLIAVTPAKSTTATAHTPATTGKVNPKKRVAPAEPKTPGSKRQKTEPFTPLTNLVNTNNNTYMMD